MTQQSIRTAQTKIHCEPSTLAAAAELVYVSDSEPGFYRRRCGRGFTYINSGGNTVRDPEQRTRFAALAIPPAWREVWICANPNGHLLVTGRDEAERKQYIYHPRWVTMRDQAKYERLRLFGEALPHLRAQVQADLRTRSLTRVKVTALVVNLLEETLIRIGNEEYARHHATYGLTTLQDDHVAIEGKAVVFEFRGKSGKEHEIVVEDRRLARLVQACQELPGQQLFQYIDENGEICGLTSTQVNDYLRSVTGCGFTAKDFRTWGGTVTAARLLHQAGLGATQKECEHILVQVVKQVAEALGNTPAVCRQHYIHPALLTAYLDRCLPALYADVVRLQKTGSDLTEDEVVVYAILCSEANHSVKDPVKKRVQK